MRGYFTFVLVFISIILLLGLLNLPNSVANKKNEIAGERAYQLQLNIKDSLFESAEVGIKQGLIEYLLFNEGPYNPIEAKKLAQLRAYQKIEKLTTWEYAEDFEVKIWCGYVRPNEVEQLSKKMLENKKIEICDNCREFSSLECENFINLDFSSEYGFSNVWFGENNPLTPLETGIVGISVYSKKFNVAGASYLPQSEKRGIV